MTSMIGTLQSHCKSEHNQGKWNKITIITTWITVFDLKLKLVDIMAYIRIQGKCLTCSKRASYFGNTSWPDSPKLMKVLMTISLNRLSSLHIPSLHIIHFTVSYENMW